jgi:hypothetical protein
MKDVKAQMRLARLIIKREGCYYRLGIKNDDDNAIYYAERVEEE